MLNSTLYEFHIGLGILSCFDPLFFIILGLLMKKLDPDKSKYAAILKFNNNTWKKIIVLGIILQLFFLHHFIVDYLDPYIRYKSGKSCEVVEGRIEDFITGEREETFTVNNVIFSYSSYKTRTGYHKIQSEGGVIKGDGQYVRIYYISDSKHGNVIVRIEEMDADE